MLPVMVSVSLVTFFCIENFFVDVKLGTRRTSSSVNLVNVNRAEKAHERYRRHQPLIPRFARATDMTGAPLPGAVNFTNIRCTIGPLKAGQEVAVAIRGRLWVRTLRKVSRTIFSLA